MLKTIYDKFNKKRTEIERKRKLKNAVKFLSRLSK